MPTSMADQDSAEFHHDILSREDEMYAVIEELDPIEGGDIQEAAHKAARNDLAEGWDGRFQYKQTAYEQRWDSPKAKKLLDSSESETKDGLKAQLKQVQDSVIKQIEGAKDFNSDYVAGFTIDLPPDVQRPLQDMFEHAWNEGRDAGVKELPTKAKKTPEVEAVKTFIQDPLFLPTWCHGAVSYYDQRPNPTKIAVEVHWEWGAKRFANAFEPTDAMKAFENRAWLIKDVIGSALQSNVRYELFEHLKGGRTLGETIDRIRQIFEPWIGDPSQIEPDSEDLLQAFRINNIVRTETTWAYNQGRLAVGDAAGDYVIGYQFSAILDDRTTDVCRRAGRRGNPLVLRKDDPRTIKLTPPLHFQCRSVYVYVTTDDVPVEWSSDAQINAVLALVPGSFK